MTREEHIKKLEEAREWMITTALAWLERGRTGGKSNIAEELTEYDGFLKRAQRTQDLLLALRAEVNPGAIPSPPPLRRRQMDLDP